MSHSLLYPASKMIEPMSPASPSSKLEFVVKAEEAGMRLDMFLLKRAVLPSRKKIKKLIDLGGVRSISKLMRIASWSVHTQDHISVCAALAQQLKGTSTATSSSYRRKDCCILYEDEHVLAINKPAGLLCTPSSRPSKKPYVLDLLRDTHHKLRLIHRLDEETSGVLLLTKTPAAYRMIRQQWYKRSVKKLYLALVTPLPRVIQHQSSWTQTSYLSQNSDASGRILTTTQAQGRWASTQFSVLWQDAEKNLALLRSSPLTGRTHQIRLHLADQGSALIGDKLYGTGAWHDLPHNAVLLALQRHMLHAHSLELMLPATKEGLATKIHAPLGGNFAELCRTLDLPSLLLSVK